MDFEITPMTTEHLEAVAFIESECFNPPRSFQALYDELDNPLFCFFVCIYEGDVIGYIGAYDVCGEASVTDVAVLEPYRGRGAGKALLQGLIDEMKKRNAHVINLEVRKSNEAAQSLYKKYGFEVCGCRPGFYSNPKEDAVLMVKRL